MDASAQQVRVGPLPAEGTTEGVVVSPDSNPAPTESTCTGGVRVQARRSNRALAALACALLLGAVTTQPAHAQEPADSEPPVERVQIPNQAFTRVLALHPGGVLLTSVELDRLEARARNQPAPPPLLSPAPLHATIQRLRTTGSYRASTQAATFECEADVALLHAGAYALPLPLGGIGLEGVWLGEAPARVLLTDAGPVALLPAGAPNRVLRLRWRFALRAKPLDERDAGYLLLRLPSAAASSVDFQLPGDFELTQAPSTSPPGPHAAPSPPAAPRSLWSEREGAVTHLRAALGGGSGVESLALAWRPRRAAARLAPFVSCVDESLFVFRAGMVELRSNLIFKLERAATSRLQATLPPGFVVRTLTSSLGEQLSHVQRGDRLEFLLASPRLGELTLSLHAERLGAPPDQRLELQPLRLLGIQRTSGTLALASSKETTLSVLETARLERADLSASAFAGQAGLLQVYRRDGRAAPSFAVRLSQRAPSVELRVHTALRLERRQVKALVLYRFSLRHGSVFSLRAIVPQHYTVDEVLVTGADEGAIAHRLSQHRLPLSDGSDPETTAPPSELVIELDEALDSARDVLVRLTATRELAAALGEGPSGAATDLDLPRFDGAPRTELRALIGVASDPVLRVSTDSSRGLLPLPADRLPALGVDLDDLQLGYRVEASGYSARLRVRARTTRVGVEALAHHLVDERVVTTDARLDIDVLGAPLETLVLRVPKAAAAALRARGRQLSDEHELLGPDPESSALARVRLRFQRPVSGRRSLRITFQTKVAEGGACALPRVLVEGATRQRGVLAVFSRAAGQLSASPSGLRPIEVTEVRALRTGAALKARPLFAYTWAREKHSLDLTLKRHQPAPVLTAVAERLELKTSASPDGSARHTATFRLRNLNNQFFALDLPEGAVLWSVVVDGQGVKPAAQGERRLVPLPNRKATTQKTTIVATYTTQKDAWGSWTDSTLAAPTLSFGEGGDAVPVLHTRWSLSLPEDYRVVSVAGNLGEHPAPQVSPLLLSAWTDLRGGSLPWLALCALVVLGVTASKAGRAALLACAVNTLRLGSGARATAVAAGTGLATSRAAQVGTLLIAVTIAALVLRPGSEFAPQAPRKASADKAGRRTMTQAQGGKPTASANLEVTPRRGAIATTGADEKAEDGAARFGREQDRAKAKEEQQPSEGNQPQKSEPEPDADAPSEEVPESKNALKRFENESDKDSGRRGATTESRPSAKTGDLQKPSVPPDLPARVADPTAGPGQKAKLQADENGGEGRGADKQSGAGGRARTRVGDEEAEELKDEEEDRLVDARAFDSWGETAKPKPAARLDDFGDGGQVGLRSLVVELRAVGVDQVFERPGGGASLQIGLVSESLLVTWAALLALLGFFASLLLPRTGKLSAVALVLGLLAFATSVGFLVQGVAAVAALNGLSLGVLVAAPALGAFALANALRAGAWDRLRGALAQRSAPSRESAPEL